jgi:hypothetical protein
VQQSAAKKKVMTKLPAKLFSDFSRNGALSRILCCALQYKNEQVARSDRVAPLRACPCPVP